MLPKGLGNIGQLGNLVKQAMDMKEKIEEVKASLADVVVSAEAGAGLVRAEVNGNMEVVSLKIDPEIMDKENPEVVEAMVLAAMNEANQKAQDIVKEKMQEMAGGFDIPGLTS